MKRDIETILAVGILAAVVANVVVSFRTGNWAFASSSQRIAQRLFTVLTLLVLLFACASLLRWMDSFWFIVVAVGGQIVWQLWLAASKLMKQG